MSNATLQKKVLGLQAELELIKRSLKKDPVFGIDEKNWERSKMQVKRVRSMLYQQRYGKR